MSLSSTAFALDQSDTIVTSNVGLFEISMTKYPDLISESLCESKITLSEQQIDRSLAEIFIICEAFKSQGLTLRPAFVAIPNDERGIVLLEQGVLDFLASSVWQYQFKDKTVLVTSPVIRAGEFEKGIYVKSDNYELLQTHHSDLNLSELTGVVDEKWHIDIPVIEQLTDNVLKISHTPSLLTFLENGKADFMLLEFASKATFEVCRFNLCIHPIPGIKVAFNEERHFVVSKTARRGQELFEILEKGLGALRKSKRIREIYTEMGLFNERVRDWKVVNKSPNTSN